MDLCLIPPIAHLHQFPQKRHLVLSHLLQHKQYRDFYTWRREQGDYIILDNSAHENGIGEGAEKLLLQALVLQAQELVVPDALEDSERTVDFARRALETWFGSLGRLSLREVNIRLMYVPQGKNPDDWARCLTQLMHLHEDACLSRGAGLACTIGISKDYGSWPGGLDELLLLLQPLKQDIEIHLLGCGHDYWTPRILADKHPIRSIDTAKPFVWAINDLVMEPMPRRLHEGMPSRPREYFFMELENLDLAKENAETLRELIEG